MYVLLPELSMSNPKLIIPLEVELMAKNVYDR